MSLVLGSAISDIKLNIKPCGNNLGVRLAAAIAHQAYLHVDQRVCMLN